MDYKDTWRCDSCEHLGFHTGGSFQNVAEGNDDPYTYEFCIKQGWSGPEEPEPGTVAVWDDCEFYKEKQPKEKINTAPKNRIIGHNDD